MINSQCKEGLHKFEDRDDNHFALIERCVQCGKKIIFKKIGQGIDKKKYMKYHKRDFLQPMGRTLKLFKRIHGK